MMFKAHPSSKNAMPACIQQVSKLSWAPGHFYKIPRTSFHSYYLWSIIMVMTPNAIGLPLPIPLFSEVFALLLSGDGIYFSTFSLGWPVISFDQQNVGELKPSEAFRVSASVLG